MADIFDEVSEDLRKDQYKQIWLKYKKFIISFIFIFVLSLMTFKYVEYYQEKKKTEIAILYFEGIDEIKNKNYKKAEDIFNKIDSKYLLKIDGDNQFSEDDILYLTKKGEDENYDFIKCDRFWEGGIKGDIPFIRYLGNALASFFIKLTTGNWKINDPLNGLFFIPLNSLFRKYVYCRFDKANKKRYKIKKNEINDV